MYTVVKRFFDLQDKNHAYEVGDRFPHNGLEVSADRIDELASNRNKLGVPLIKEIKEKQNRTRARENVE